MVAEIIHAGDAVALGKFQIALPAIVVDRNGRGKSCRHCSGGEAGLPYFLPKSAGTSPHFSVSHFRILHL